MQLGIFSLMGISQIESTRLFELSVFGYFSLLVGFLDLSGVVKNER